MKNQKGFSLVELLVVVIIIAIIAAIAIPNLLASRRAAGESAAVASIRTLHSAQATYQSLNAPVYGTLAELGTAGLIDAALAGGTKNSYTYVVTRNGTNTLYCATATPTASSAGVRIYAVASDGTIYQSAADGTNPPTCAAGVRADGVVLP